MPKLDLAEQYLNGVREIFARHAPGVWAWAYGSRVHGTNHPASDLDLIVHGPGGSPVGATLLGRLRGAFVESDLPIMVDVADWSRVPPRFREEVERGCVRVVEGAESEGAPKGSPASLGADSR